MSLKIIERISELKQKIRSLNAEIAKLEKIEITCDLKLELGSNSDVVWITRQHQNCDRSTSLQFNLDELRLLHSVLGKFLENS